MKVVDSIKENIFDSKSLPIIKLKSLLRKNLLDKRKECSLEQEQKLN